MARIISVAALPILSRLYLPADFGLLASFTAALTLILPLATLRYAQVIPIVRSEGGARAMANVAYASLGGTSVVLLISLLLAVQWEAELGGLRLSYVTAGFLLLAYLLSGAYEILSSQATRDRRYRSLSATSMKQSAVSAVAKTLFGMASLRPEGLLLGHVVGLGAGLLSLNVGAKSQRSVGGAGAKRAMTLARSFWQFPALRLPSQFLLAGASQLPVLYVAAAYDLETAGFFGMAMVLMTTTISMATISLGQAFYGEIAAVYRKTPERVAEFTFAIQVRLLIAGAAAAAFIYFAAPYVVVTLLGSKWEVTGIIVSYLSPYLLFQFASTPVVRVMDLLRVQWLFLLINGTRLAAVGGVALYTHATEGTVLEFVRIYSIIMSLFYIGVTGVVFVALRTPGILTRNRS